MQIEKVIALIEKQASSFKQTALSASARDPFKILISCIISQRTKDAVTEAASERLFRIAKSPEEMSGLSAKQVEKAIYPAGFYKTKARRIINIGAELVEKYSSRVPDTIEELLKFHGVGRKTANIVVTSGYGKKGIPVDTHVHRISNRLGYVRTRTPEETEFALRKKLPVRYWLSYNDLLVTFGQNVCLPISPKCSQCAISKLCPKIGVDRHR